MDIIRFRCAACGLFVDADLLSSHACPQSDAGTYEDNLALQESLGGSVMKACRDINDAAPVVDSPSIDSCAVCLEPCTRVRKARACSHEFCAACMESWLSSHVTCPVCVADLSVHGGHRYVIDEASPPPPQATPVMLSLTVVRRSAQEPPPRHVEPRSPSHDVLDSFNNMMYHSRQIFDLLRLDIDRA